MSPAASIDNALRAATDAFGTNIGRESIGLYSPQSVRGFSPYSAGNIRVEGLYIDAVALPNNKVVSGSSIRVGISSLGFPFPAPTGIADYRLRIPGGNPGVSVGVGANSLGGMNAELDVNIPVAGDRFAIGGGITVADDRPYWGGEAAHMTAAAVARIAPVDGVEILPFYSYFAHLDEDTAPRLTVGGEFLPPRIERGGNIGQPWAIWNQEHINYGVIGRAGLGNGWNLSAGGFYSKIGRDTSYSDQFQSVSTDGVATNHRMVVSPGVSNSSTSGEMRLSRRFTALGGAHMLHASVRARKQNRLYGGGRQFDFGPDPVEAGTEFEEPTYTLGAQSKDAIRQYAGGLAYEGIWASLGELSLGIQKAYYQKTSIPVGTLPVITKSEPWLYNAAVAVEILDTLAVYAGMTRGLEDSSSAPETAVNRDVAPPAILTQQYDVGVRWDVLPGVKLIGGLFSVEKPYFSVDSERIYRQLGDVLYRGVELSLTGQVTDSLTILAGAVLLDPSVEGEAVDAGLVGAKPVGSSPSLLSVNVQYTVPGLRGLILDAGWTRNGERVANNRNTLSVPAASIVDIGLRYGWKLFGRRTNLRLQVANVFNTYDWDIISSNTFAYARQREMTLRVTMSL